MGKYIAYSAYKDSGVEWLVDVPEHWEIRKLKFAVDLISKKCEAKDSELQFIGLENIESFTGKMITANNELESEGIALSYKANDVLFCKLRPYLAKVYLAENSGLCTSELLVLRQIEVFPNFLKYFLLSQQFINIVDSSTYGSKMPRANWEFIGNLACLIPDKDEQQQVADFLDDKTAHLDKLIGQKQQMIVLLNEKRMALITEAVTKGLDLSVPMKDSGVEWLGDVPKHWIVAGLTKFIESQVDYRGKTPEKVKSGTFLVTARNIKEGQINYDLSSEFVREEDYLEIMRRGIPEIGDVLFTTEAPLGEIANIDRTDIALAQRIIKIRGNSGILNNYFLKYWMMSAKFQQHLWSLATGSTALGIKASKIFELRCVIPPFQEQIDIVAYIDTETQKIDDMIKTVKQAIGTLQEYRTALITAAVTGKIDVRGYKSTLYDWAAPVITEPQKP